MFPRQLRHLSPIALGVDPEHVPIRTRLRHLLDLLPVLPCANHGHDWLVLRAHTPILHEGVRLDIRPSQLPPLDQHVLEHNITDRVRFVEALPLDPQRIGHRTNALERHPLPVSSRPGLESRRMFRSTGKSTAAIPPCGLR